MTLSLGSRQHRKSMLPTPRLSSRISSRRAVSSDTSRIARRVPSPLLATPDNNGSTAQQARVPQPEANFQLSLPKQLQVTSTWRAGLPSRIPGLLGQASCCPTPTPEQSDASSSLISAPRPEVKKADAQDLTLPPPSAGLPKGELRLNSQDGRTVPARQQEPETRNPASSSPSSARLQHPTTRHRASTAFAAGFSRIENTLSGDSARAAGALPSSTRKKSSFTTSVSGKENRQPQLRTRVPAPPVMPPVAAVSSVPPRSIRRTVTVVAQPSRGSFRESHPRPLVVIKKRTSHTHAPAAGSSPREDSRIRSAAAGELSARLGFPARIKALMEDVDCFAREWTEIFDELLSTGGANGLEGGRPSKLDSFTRIHPSVQPESAGMCQADGPVMEKRTHKLSLPVPSGSAGSASTLQVSPLHRENAMVKDASVNDKSERDSPGASSTLGPDHPGDCGNRHPQKDLQNVSLPPTHQVSRYYLHLPNINQSPIISGSHLGEMTSVGPSNRKDELAKLPESHPITPRGANRTRRNGSTHHARIYPSAMLSSVSSPFSSITSLISASNPYLSSPWVNLQSHECSPQRIVNGASDAALTRSSSLRGLRAIFKRTSARLTSGQRQ